jgi:DNA modification methylase
MTKNEDSDDLNVFYYRVNDLIPYARNARTHDEIQVNQIAASIKEFGFTNPILVDKDKGIIAGHGRLQAAIKLKMNQVPCIRLHNLSDTQKKAYIIADNQLALNAGWDTGLLSLDLLELQDEEFDLELLGFDQKELDKLLEPDNVEGNTEDDAIPEDVETRCKPGDIWQLGNHRVMCGDSTNVQHVDKLLDGAKIDMVFTDPPYGVNERTNRKSSGRCKLAENQDLQPVIGDDSTQTAIDAYELCKGLKIPLLFFWGGNYFADKFPITSSWVIWDKRENKGQDDNADCEMAWTNRGGPSRVFYHLWKGCIRKSEKNEKKVHPTQKPVELAVWSIKDYPKKKVDDVLDLFLGSGSTLIACEKTNRKCYGMELDPHYCDVIITRWEQFTGKQGELTNG